MSIQLTETQQSFQPANAYATTKQAIIHDYLHGGMSSAQLAAKYGNTHQSMMVKLWRWGVKLDPAERARRHAEKCRRMNHANAGRPSSWPDCPPERRAEFVRLMSQYRYRAAEARALIEADMARNPA